MTHPPHHKNQNDKNEKDDWQSLYSDIISQGTASSTRRTYERDVTYFWVWSQLALQQRERYPVSEESVIHFVLDHMGYMDADVEARLIKKDHKHNRGH